MAMDAAKSPHRLRKPWQGMPLGPSVWSRRTFVRRRCPAILGTTNYHGLTDALLEEGSDSILYQAGLQ